MSQKSCSLTTNREETLIAYLYDDGDPAARATFAEHLLACDRCQTDLHELADVRTQLARWSPPEPNFAGSRRLADAAGNRPRWYRWREMPAWAQVAAASLFLGIGAGLANVDVRYDDKGLSVRTGWWRSAAPERASAGPAGIGTSTPAAWRADLAEVEQRLRHDLRAAQPIPAPSRQGPADGEILRRVRTMLEESERRQQNELALRVAEVYADLNAKRQMEIYRIGRSLKNTENKLGSQLGAVGAEVLRTRNSLNYIMNVNQKQ